MDIPSNQKLAEVSSSIKGEEPIINKDEGRKVSRKRKPPPPQLQSPEDTPPVITRVHERLRYLPLETYTVVNIDYIISYRIFPEQQKLKKIKLHVCEQIVPHVGNIAYSYKNQVTYVHVQCVRTCTVVHFKLITQTFPVLHILYACCV